MTNDRISGKLTTKARPNNCNSGFWHRIYSSGYAYGFFENGRDPYEKELINELFKELKYRSYADEEQHFINFIRVFNFLAILQLKHKFDKNLYCPSLTQLINQGGGLDAVDSFLQSFNNNIYTSTIIVMLDRMGRTVKDIHTLKYRKGTEPLKVT
uniref:LAGLIDADG homing endonuclease n=1 Tax=Romanomermis culicivorax TaxID=13658 RepID=A0A915I9P5_ROMCU